MGQTKSMLSLGAPPGAELAHINNSIRRGAGYYGSIITLLKAGRSYGAKALLGT